MDYNVKFPSLLSPLPVKPCPVKTKSIFTALAVCLCVITGWTVVSVFLNGRRDASWTHESFSFCVSVYWDRKYWTTGCFCQLLKKILVRVCTFTPEEELWSFNNCLILREYRSPHHNYNGTEEQYHRNLFQNLFSQLMNNTTLTSSQNPQLNEPEHLNRQMTLLQCTLLIHRTLSSTGVDTNYGCKINCNKTKIAMWLCVFYQIAKAEV